MGTVCSQLIFTTCCFMRLVWCFLFLSYASVSYVSDCSLLVPNCRTHLHELRLGCRNCKSKVFMLWFFLFYELVDVYTLYLKLLCEQKCKKCIAFFHCPSGCPCIVIVFILFYTSSKHVSQCADFGFPGNPNLVMALAGNKADLEEKRKVTADVSYSITGSYCTL